MIDYLRTFTYDSNLSEEPLVTEPMAATPSDETNIAEGCVTDQANPLDWDDSQAIQAGQLIYQAQCASCHGADGTGGLPDKPDFTSVEVNRDLLADAGRYRCVVSGGTGVMPPYGGALTEEEQWQVITYIASLGS